MSENLTFFNGERLKLARLFNKMTISDLAGNVAVSKQEYLNMKRINQNRN
ncbi:MAG: hypothetical protein VB018_11470 [Lachnospiraceae bacterium]|nr:hypothetical protein [Lachnospiraceae bacterium]